MNNNFREDVRKSMSEYLSKRLSEETGMPATVVLQSLDEKLRNDLIESVKDPANIKEYHGLVTTEVVSEEKAREGFRHFPYEKRYIEPIKSVHSTNPVIKE